MFKIYNSSEKNGQTLSIISGCETTKSSICLTKGGSLEQLIVNGEEIVTNLAQFPYNQTYASSILFPYANRVKDGLYRFKGKNYTLDVNETGNHNALHGLVYNKTFNVVEQNCNSESVSLRLSYTENEPHPGFPFLFTIDLIYKFSLNTLDLEVEITNIGTQPFPFTLGWHPYFKIFNRAKSKLRFKSYQKIESDERFITTGMKAFKTPNPLYLDNISLDDAFILDDNNVAFETQTYKASLSVMNPSNYLQLYTPKHSDAIAIEPMTGVSDSFNNGIGLKKLNPGEKFNNKWSLKISINQKKNK